VQKVCKIVKSGFDMPDIEALTVYSEHAAALVVVARVLLRVSGFRAVLHFRQQARAQST
jgi:hypothetical protein